MSLKLQWSVLRSNLPARWKQVALVLALIARDDGSGIWPRAKVLAHFLGLHRVTVSHVLAELDEAGIVPVVRRGGCWRRKRAGRTVGRPVGRPTVRRIDVAKLEAFGRSDATTWSADLVAASLPDDPDLVAASLPYVKTGTYGKTGTKIGKKACKASAPAAPTVSRLLTWKENTTQAAVETLDDIDAEFVVEQEKEEKL